MMNNSRFFHGLSSYLAFIAYDRERQHIFVSPNRAGPCCSACLRLIRNICRDCSGLSVLGEFFAGKSSSSARLSSQLILIYGNATSAFGFRQAESLGYGPMSGF